MRQNTKGFSLVELMIVVAIIGILAAIAIPNFVAMQAKSKRGELPGNVNAIKQVEVTYNTAFDTYLDASPFPTTTPAKTAVAWDSASAGTFTTMGFNPNGNVRGQYQVSATTSSDFLVGAACDVDGDGIQANYTASVNAQAALEAGDEAVY